MKAIEWIDGRVVLIDQTRLPGETVMLALDDYLEVVQAIKEMRIRGAPALGIAGAYAMALAARQIEAPDMGTFLARLQEAAQQIAGARPTAVNLSWAVQRTLRVAKAASSVQDVAKTLLAEAVRIHREDEEANRRMGQLGAELVPSGSALLTHCNTGALATGGYGTALGVIMAAWEQGKVTKVFATETRPFLQGSRLTAWELAQEGIAVTVIVDAAAGYLMSKGEVSCIFVGADRIAGNGDVANKIGTYTLAVLAKVHGIPFYVAAPTSTIDLSLSGGQAILVEERPAREVTHVGGTLLTPEGIEVRNPAFDITPCNFVTAIITEKGVVREPYNQELRRTVGHGNG
ncbi:MAG: S-methyl-5-thioribose-1-phosphate isomerase [Chloroflexi bacterium]|nr:S-methyl-5-thioribose-1-phosphate isomerase [Chloroflexota bacterium]